MLIPLPTPITLQLCQRPLPFTLDQVGTLASTTAPVFGTDGVSGGGGRAPGYGAGLLAAGGRGLLSLGAYPTVCNIVSERGRRAHGGRFGAGAGSSDAQASTVMRSHWGTGTSSRFVQNGGSSSCGGRAGGRGSHTFPSGDAVVEVQGTEGDRVGVRSAIGLAGMGN